MAGTLAVVGLVVFRDLLETWQVHRGLRTVRKPPPPRKLRTEGGSG